MSRVLIVISHVCEQNWHFSTVNSECMFSHLHLTKWCLSIFWPVTSLYCAILSLLEMEKCRKSRRLCDLLPQTLQFLEDSFVSFSLLAFKWRKKFPISRHFSSSAVNKPSATSDSPPLPTLRQPRAFFLLQGTASAATPSTHALVMTPSRSRVTSLSLRTSPPPPHMFTRWAIARHRCGVGRL